MPPLNTLFYENSPFVAYLPLDYRYTRVHLWADNIAGDRLRVGFTQFATRLLGEIVDYNFEALPKSSVHLGQVLGWVEGFKGISDVVCAGNGVFVADNPALKKDTELITRTPYTDGWLYEMEGELESGSLDAQQYAGYLDSVIEQLRAKRNIHGHK